MTQAQSVTVLGPNSIPGNVFHVHTTGCADINQAKYRAAKRESGYTAGVASVQELVEFLFDDLIDESEGGWEDFIHQMVVFPCVGKLPHNG